MEWIGKYNPKVKQALALKRNKSRKGGVFLLEGFREITKALQSGFICDYLLLSPDALVEENLLIREMIAQGIAHYQVSAGILAQLSYKENGEHFVAIMRKKLWSCSEFLAARRNNLPIYIIIEQVEKPGNVGALLRIADGAGVDGVILCDPVVDLYNPNLIRSSLGTVFTLPIWIGSFNEVFALILEQKWHVIATTPSASSLYFTQDFCRPLALVFGSEKAGLTSSWLDGRFNTVRLPMLGEADSLNLSTAVAAVTYEVVRQRWLND